MLPVLTAAQMRAADRFTIEGLGLPGSVLMENAGAAVARVIDERWPAARPVVLCGKGNNGGDGFVVARRLLSRGPRVLLFAGLDDVSGDARAHLHAFLRSGGTVETLLDEAAWPLMRDAVLRADLIVDALLGTGLQKAPAGLIGEAVRDLAQRSTACAVVAVDLPSGLRSDGGETPWPVVRADVTVTFGAPKYGHVLPPACDAVGRLVVADIGIPPEALERDARLWLIDDGDLRAAFPQRVPGAHKGTYGHLLVLGGSIGKTGATALAAHAALRCGAGLVTVGVPAPALPLVVSQAPREVMTSPLPPAADGGWTGEAVEAALGLTEGRDAVVLGPGIGTEPGAGEFVRAFAPRCGLPLVIDAGGLTGLASGKDGLGLLRQRKAPTVLTPHPGEMGQLTKVSAAEVQRRRLELAGEVAGRSGAFVVLKGQRTLVADPAGRAAVNPSGNPGMATAGTGDVLAGMLGALVARGTPPWSASLAAVHLHGLAGDRAAERLGQDALMAGDLIDALPATLTALIGGR